MIAAWLFLAVPWVCLQFVIVVFPDHTHLLFCYGGEVYIRQNVVLVCMLIDVTILILNPSSGKMHGRIQKVLSGRSNSDNVFVSRLFEEKRRDLVFASPSFRPSVHPSVRPYVRPSPYKSRYLVGATPPTVLYRFV